MENVDQTYKDVINGSSSVNTSVDNFVTQSPIDVLAKSLSSSPPINACLPIKLDKHNYTILWDQLLTYVIPYILESVIDGPLVVPIRYLDDCLTSNPNLLNWNKINSFIKGCIYCFVSVSILAYLSSGMIAKK